MRRERWLLLAGIGLYLLSLLLPAVQGGFPSQTGLDVLGQGAGAWRDGVVAWYANPVLWLAWPAIWVGYHRVGLTAAGAGLVLAGSSFTASTAAALAGRSVPDFGFAIGFYVWLAAFLATAGAALLGIYKVSHGKNGALTGQNRYSRD